MCFSIELNNILQKLHLDKHLYNTHSFRIGVSSHFRKTSPHPHIKMLRRWKSDANLTYLIRTGKNVQMHHRRTFTEGSSNSSTELTSFTNSFVYFSIINFAVLGNMQPNEMQPNEIRYLGGRSLFITITIYLWPFSSFITQASINQIKQLSKVPTLAHSIVITLLIHSRQDPQHIPNTVNQQFAGSQRLEQEQLQCLSKMSIIYIHT